MVKKLDKTEQLNLGNTLMGIHYTINKFSNLVEHETTLKNYIIFQDQLKVLLGCIEDCMGRTNYTREEK